MQDLDTSPARFEKDLAQPDPIPDAGIDAALALMRDGRLFRYGEDRGTLPEAALLEEEFAAYMGRQYCLGVNSGGCAMFLALRGCGVRSGDKVLTNAFTLAPVPGAIAHAGAEAVLVDITDRYVIDCEDLDRKARESEAKVLLLSYMRGHIPDMDDVLAVCREHDLILVEDCAHTMGAHWAGKLSGTFGHIACFSTQTFKHVNSGEGGLIVTDDEDAAARMVLMSGSYMLYAQHRARPATEVFDRHRFDVPNCSMRMSALVASVLRPQLPLLKERAQRWREIYAELERLLTRIEHVWMPKRPQAEGFVPSSLQFSFTDLAPATQARIVSAAIRRGVHVKWFGETDAVGFTSRHDHWRYLRETGRVPNADAALASLCDIRLPLWLTAEDCACIARVIEESIREGCEEKPLS